MAYKPVYLTYNCAFCGKEDSKEIQRYNKATIHFCSRTCMGQYYNPVPDDGKKRSSKGYVLVYVGKEHPAAHKNGYMLEHRLIMEQLIGRPLLKHEVVHHKNGIKDDNRPENLELKTTKTHDNTYDNLLIETLNGILGVNITLQEEVIRLRIELDSLKS